jgi:hypothetical protein
MHGAKLHLNTTCSKFCQLIAHISVSEECICSTVIHWDYFLLQQTITNTLPRCCFQSWETQSFYHSLTGTAHVHTYSDVLDAMYTTFSVETDYTTDLTLKTNALVRKNGQKYKVCGSCLNVMKLAMKTQRFQEPFLHLFFKHNMTSYYFLIS